MASAYLKFVDSGLYSVSEAAMYARVPTMLMSRWLFGSKSGRAVIEPQYRNDEKLVSFLDFVQTLAIREIRLQHKVPLHKFREAIQTAKKSCGMTFPFARRHFTYLMGEEIVIKPTSDEYIEASGKHKGQRLFTFVEAYLNDLMYGRDGLAREFVIFTSRDDVKIRMNPERRFGEPLLPSGYTPHAIWEAIAAEGGIAEAAEAYDVPSKEVDAAYQFISFFGARAA